MKATGIVRRIDELGRVVIPKEIRRTMHIKEGSPLEIFVGGDGEVIFRKHSVMGALEAMSQKFAEALFKALDVPVLICDAESVVAAAGIRAEGLRPSPELEQLIDGRKAFFQGTQGVGVRALQEQDFYAGVVVPIIVDSGVAGAVVLLYEDPGRTAADNDVKLTVFSGNLLIKLLEA